MDFSSSPSVLSQATTDAGEWLLASDSSVAMSNKDCGLLGLPDEMFLEIVSHLPAFPMALDRRTCQNVDVYGHRQQVLDALCKTCAKLRRLFLQHRWKRVEICYEDATTPPIQLSQQLETATVRQPCLAAFIHVLDLYIPDSSSEEFVSRLAQCMTLLPNLHTVQLDFASQGAPSTSKELLLSKSFAKYIYPQVRTVIVSANGHSFVSQCPAVTTVHLLRPTTFSTVGFLFKIIRSCPALEKLGPLPVLFRKDSADKSSLEHYVDVISERLQTVREVTFAMSKLPSDSVSSFSLFSLLSSLFSLLSAPCLSF
ncbi:hypothetical protein BDN70DRAFT_436279 [Pholiota conissans]|uniref:F-box domain-containing protein n=1 Tax=Pholiota conissans TaxID=109636 RepID=A0A9P5Z836_9AGAR|nr:hypothetical protein BDN70DRAFT_436279 [Pholiota conissans]